MKIVVMDEKYVLLLIYSSAICVTVFIGLVGLPLSLTKKERASQVVEEKLLVEITEFLVIFFGM